MLLLWSGKLVMVLAESEMAVNTQAINTNTTITIRPIAYNLCATGGIFAWDIRRSIPYLGCRL
jgi:hypothetical protein